MPPITIHNHWIDKLAVLVGFVSGFALYPQAYMLMTSAHTENVAISTYAIILINSIVWMIYSIHRALFSLAIPSFLNICVSLAVILWYFSV